VKPGLEALKSKGIKLAILSNGNPKMLEAAVKAPGSPIFSTLSSSVEEVKIYKVSPRVYNLGPERMKVKNPELGFISANSWDINGAAPPACGRSGSNAPPRTRRRNSGSGTSGQGDHGSRPAATPVNARRRKAETTRVAHDRGQVRTLDGFRSTREPSRSLIG